MDTRYNTKALNTPVGRNAQTVDPWALRVARLAADARALENRITLWSIATVPELRNPELTSDHEEVVSALQKGHSVAKVDRHYSRRLLQRGLSTFITEANAVYSELDHGNYDVLEGETPAQKAIRESKIQLSQALRGAMFTAKALAEGIAQIESGENPRMRQDRSLLNSLGGTSVIVDPFQSVSTEIREAVAKAKYDFGHGPGILPIGAALREVLPLSVRIGEQAVEAEPQFTTEGHEPLLLQFGHQEAGHYM